MVVLRLSFFPQNLAQIRRHRDLSCPLQTWGGAPPGRRTQTDQEEHAEYAGRGRGKPTDLTKASTKDVIVHLARDIELYVQDHPGVSIYIDCFLQQSSWSDTQVRPEMTFMLKRHRGVAVQGNSAARDVSLASFNPRSFPVSAERESK